MCRLQFLGFVVITLLVGVGDTVQSAEIRALGRVNLFGDFIVESNMTDSETSDPFTRSKVSVGDALPCVYEYSASSDIGALELKVFGSLTNNESEPMGEIEVGVLRAIQSGRHDSNMRPPAPKSRISNPIRPGLYDENPSFTMRN